VQPPSTLSDVLTALGKIHTIDQARTKQLAAAIRTCGRLLNRPLEGLPASPKLLLPMLLELTPQRSIRSAKTLANMRTLVKRALILTGAGRRVRHDGTPLSPAWQALYNQLPTKRLKYALSRLIHYANQASVRPDQVNQSFLDQFVADIAKSGEVKNVPLRHRDSAIFWNQSATAIKGWPQTLLHEPVIKRVMRNLTWDQLPENLRQKLTITVHGLVAPTYSPRTVQQDLANPQQFVSGVKFSASSHRTLLRAGLYQTRPTHWIRSLIRTMQK
jgi:hypothetical protein